MGTISQLEDSATRTAVSGSLSTGEWRDFWALLKPRVMTLVVFTAACGLIVAPGTLSPFLSFVAILCIGVGAGASGAFNQWLEADTDALMKRTASRPLPAGRLAREDALVFAIMLSGASVLTLWLATNWVAAAILAFAIFFYAVVYTIWLKPNTPQNIVIGGAAGAFPPVIGWAAVTGDVTALPLLLFAIIFAWTPPHFWALAMFIRKDYANAQMPMLPLTHGLAETRRQILIYSIVLLAVSVAPFALGLTGALYGLFAALLGVVFLALAIGVARATAEEPADMLAEKRLFKFSILYLFLLFGVLVADAAWMRP